MPETSINEDSLTCQIIGAAIEAHRSLGPGLLEGLYEDALCIELADQGLRYQRQKIIDVYYKRRPLGELHADLIIENTVIVELKSVERLLAVHEAQLLTYLRLTNLRRGLLINFNVRFLKEGIKRLVN